jgi:hypothetical protein
VHQPGELPPFQRAFAGQRCGDLIDLAAADGVDQRGAAGRERRRPVPVGRLPLFAIVLPPASARLYVTVVCVLAALVVCGWASARTGHAPVRPAVLRNVAGGALAMALIYGAGSLLGASGI